jgi:hypothetical protein
MFRMSSASFLRSVIVLLLAVCSLTVSDTILTTGVWNGVFHEVGIAFLVSLIIWSVFELYRAEINEQEWNSRIDRATKNVFFAVLQKDLPTKLLNAARKLALDVSLIRTDFRVNYTLRDTTYKTSESPKAAGVLMEAVVSYKLKNVGAEATPFTPAIMLPNPFHEQLKGQVCVKYLNVKNSSDSLLEIDFPSAEKRFKEELKSDKNQVHFAAKEILIQPSDEITFSANYVMAKEEEDVELLETAYPSDGIYVAIVDKGPSKRRITGRSVHPESLQPQPAADTLVYTISGFLLPHQGVLISWKKAREEKEKAAAT